MKTESLDPESDASFRELIFSQGEGIGITDAQDRFTFANPAGDALFGLPPGGLLGRTLQEFTNQNEYARVLEETERRRAGNKSTYELNIVRKDGQDRCLLVTGVPRMDKTGNFVGTYAIFLDITERKQAEAALEESHVRYRHLFEMESDAIVLVENQTGRILEANQAACTLYGYTRDEWLRIKHTDVSAEPSETRRAALEGWSVVPLRWHKKRDGTVFPVEITGSHFQFEGRSVHIAAIRDITERVKAEETLRRSNERFKLLADTAGTLLTAENPLLVIDQLCRSVMSHLKCQVSFSYLADEESGRLKLNTWVGLSDQAAKELEWLDYGVAVSGSVARDRRVIVLEDVLNARNPIADLVRRYGTQACCCHPLIAQGALIGTLLFATTTRPRLTAEEVQLMRTVADQVAVAMERMRSQAALERTEERFRTLVEVAPEAIFIQSDGCFAYVNPATVALLNAASPGDLLGKRVMDHFHPDSRQQVLDGMRHIRDGGVRVASFNEIRLNAAGSLRLVNMSAARFKHRGQDSVLVFARDITKRKLAESKVMDQLEELRRWHDITLGRESRILELKRQVNELLEKAGQPIRYPSAARGMNIGEEPGRPTVGPNGSQETPLPE